MPLRDQVVGNVRRAVLVLLGSVTLVLLIACANVANLLLTRASGTPEGSGDSHRARRAWQRLVRQLLTESMLLGLLGGAAGLLIAQASLYVVRTINPGNIPAPGRDHDRPAVLALHVRRVAPDRHHVRSRAGVPRRRGRSQQRR